MRVLDTGDVKDVTALAFAPDGRYLAAGMSRRGPVVYDLSRVGPGVAIGGNNFPRQAVVGFEPDGRVLTALTNDGRTRFDTATGACLDITPATSFIPGLILAFDASIAGDRMAAIVLQPRRELLVGLRSTGNTWAPAWDTELGLTSDPSLSPDGDRVAVVASPTPGRGDGFRLLIHEWDTGRLVGDGAYPYAWVARPRFRPDGRQVVACHDRNLLVWDTRRLGKPVKVPNDSRRAFTAAAYHPSGRYLFTTSNDATVTVWDTDNWVRVKRFAWDIGRLRSVAVSADGLLAAAGSDRGRVVVWDVDV